MNNIEDIMNEVYYPILAQYLDVFLEELPGFPPKKELEFTIQLKPRT
jgi:hypothetical protein